MQSPRRSRPEPLPLSPELLVAAYSRGYFPMARSRRHRDVEWFSPDPRAVLPLDGLIVSRSLRRVVRSGRFEVRSDTAFDRVVRACAAPRAGHPQTWINEAIRESYGALHVMGLAHSVEAWRDGRLVGGLYGVALGGAFFGESMFHRPDLGGGEASKVCLVHLVERLTARGYTLLDVQINSEHMAGLGAIDIPRAQYLQRLRPALALDVRWSDADEPSPEEFPPPLGGVGGG